MGSDIAVSYQGSASCAWAVTWAAVEAARLGSRLRIVVAADTASLGGCPPAQLVQRFAELRRRADLLAAEATTLAWAAAPGLRLDPAVHVGPVASVLVAASRDAEAVVLASGRGRVAQRQARLVEALAAHARCPVLVTGEADAPHPGPGRPVVVGVDGSDHAAAALDRAAEAAVRAGAPLQVVCVYSARSLPASDPASTPRRAVIHRREAHGVTAAAVARVRRDHPGLEVTSATLSGNPARVLPRVARRAGLLVVGRRGQGAQLSLLVGSVSRAALRALPCPVAVGGPLARGADAILSMPALLAEIATTD